MPPKKKQQQKANAKSKPPAAGSKPAPKLQISSENERRLRRLLLNNERTPPAPAAAPTQTPLTATPIPETGVPSAVPDGGGPSRAQKAKRLRAVYDKLSLEGFSSDQIERALTALKESATFESALDWLCFNVPGNELPIKFSSAGASTSIQEGTVTIVSAARQDHISQQQRRDTEREKENIPGVPLKIKVQRDELSLDFGNSLNKEWIQHYLEQEDDEDEQEDNPDSRAGSIVEEYHRARAGALEAKKKGDKRSQDHFSDVISKLRKELSLLGISNEILIPNFQNDSTIESCDDISCDSSYYGTLESKESDTNSSKATVFENKALVDVNADEAFRQKENDRTAALPETDADGNTNESEELQLDNLFSEDLSPLDVVPAEIQTQQQKSRVLQTAYGYNLGNIEEIWKKGDLGKFPKAVLQKICQRLGWDPPKYSKQSGKEDKFQYSVGILRTASGRGKSRKAGGFITIHLPNNEEAFTSVEEAQNKVACFALYQLFPELPLNQMLLEPYPSFISMWQKDDFSVKLEDVEDARRSGFINSLLNLERSSSVHSLDAQNISLLQDVVEPQYVEEAYGDSLEKIRVLGSDNTGVACSEQTENLLLKKEQEDKMKLPNYMKMLEARAALPISRLKNDILQLLAENNVIVVHGETGCGKTTQVPQFILDDMIRSGHGAYCNIVCTQPRRLAAISVAERVSDERCESSPGSDGSLVGYQVRLDSARNERTKLLFCTTGVLLRKLTGNKNLAGFTHVIVDEVHERSILGDFLLIVLKSILEKQSDSQGRKLKVVLMSATVDSSLFSRYFGNCPVISAEGRTHPVSAYFLEDVYEKLGYCLPSDSPAYGALATSSRRKHRTSSVDNHRGKKNLVLSSWGDDSLLLEDYVNPCYFPDHYISYSERTRQNLKHLNEDVIDFDLLEDLIRFIDQNYPSGAILVFLPGVAEIDMLVDKLTSSVQFGGVSSEWILPLHSSLAAAEQRKVFLNPPRNVRKVIIATDIAETSITIDDVTYVVDAGKHKENRYNAQKKMSSMVEDWISQANAKQRRGRAGRVKPGTCFCLYTHYRFESLMRSFQIPEMLRMQLTELCLQIKSLSLGDVKSFLMKAIEPPREDAISSAINILYEVGAFEGNEELSPLGHHLAKLPVDVLIGKMMLYGAIFGCLSPILSVAAFLSYKTPFVYPRDEKQNVERAKSALLNGNSDGGTTSNDGIKQSDHLLMVSAYNKWARILHENGSKAAQQFCRSFFLNGSVMYMIRDMRIQFGTLLADIGLLKFPDRFQLRDKRRDKLESWLADVSQPFNLYSNHFSIIQSIICAGLYPNVAATIEGIVGQSLLGSRAISTSLKDQRTWFDGRREVHIHPSSINHNVKNFQYPFLVFLEKVETSKVYIRDCSIISPYSILLFGGSMVIQHQEGLVFIDGWLKLNAPAQTAVLFKELRATLHAVLKDLISKPEMATSVNNEVVKYIVQLLLEEEKVQVSK